MSAILIVSLKKAWLMGKIVTLLLLFFVSSAAWAGAVHKAISAEAQPLVYNWDSGTRGCGIRLIVLTDIPSPLHVLDTSLNIFKKGADFWGTVKGGYAYLEQGKSNKISLKPITIESINFLFGTGNRVAHDKYENASTPGHLMAGSDPVEIANFLLETLNEVEVMVSVKLSNESTDRVFRFNPVFESGEAALFRKCMGGLGS